MNFKKLTLHSIGINNKEPRFRIGKYMKTIESRIIGINKTDYINENKYNKKHYLIDKRTIGKPKFKLMNNIIIVEKH